MRTIPALLALALFSAVAVAAEAPSTKQAAGNMHVAANTQMPHQGKVVSSIDASIYTYIEVSEAGKTVWLAAPTVAVKKGETIGYDDGAVMTNFFSKSLNRTFETVIFVGKAVVIK
jgi:hypothetical protein